MQSKESFLPVMTISPQHQEKMGQKWGKHHAVFSRGNLWHRYIFVSCKCMQFFCLIAFGNTTNENVHAHLNECICLFAYLSACCLICTLCVCAREPTHVNVSMFLSRPGLVFISPVAPTMFPSPSQGAQDNFPLHAARPLK